MLKTTLLGFSLIFSLSIFAQTNEDSLLVSRFRPGIMWFYTGFRPAKPEKVRKYDRLMVDLTYNDWTGDQKAFKSKWSSIGFNTSLMFDIPVTKGNTFSIGAGICYGLGVIRHDQLLDSDPTYTFTRLVPDSLNSLDKGKLISNTLSIPLELRFRTKGWKHVKVHLGGKIGYQLNAVEKNVLFKENGKEIHKIYGFPDLNRLIYDVHARIGVRNWAFYASYNLNRLFSNTSSSKLNLFQLGITLSLF